MVVSRRQIFICDKHELVNEEVIIEGDSLFGFDGVWYKIGLCPICHKELVSAAQEFITEHGLKLNASDVVPTKPAPKGGTPVSTQAGVAFDAPCLWCDYVRTIGALQYHVRSKHGFDGFKDAYGDTCPICNKHDMGALSSHAQKTHDCVNVAELFQKAMQLGDLHGVVAKRMAKAA